MAKYIDHEGNDLIVGHSHAIATRTDARMEVAELISHVSIVQQVMKAVMKPEVHYGNIPGTDKPTLLKPGAEVLCMAFRIADEYRVEDMSTPDYIRYRVTCIGRHQNSGVELGSGLGEASSSEEKYKWRKAVCQEEFDDTPEHLRRKKYGKAKGGGFYTQIQVRTEPADLANTILKMANKRAKMAMTLNVTAASDLFAQDLDDMDEAMREHLTRKQDEVKDPSFPKVWPDDEFNKRIPKFQQAINEGKSPEDVILWAQAKAALNSSQHDIIMSMVKQS